MTETDVGHSGQVASPAGGKRGLAVIRTRRRLLSRRRGMPLAAVLVAVALTAACSSSTSGGGSSAGGAGGTSAVANSSPDVSSVTLNVGDQKGTGAQALLQAAGLISKLPFKVTWSDFSSGPLLLQAMGSGSVDIGGVGDAPPVFAAAGGEKVALVGARTQLPASAALIVPKNSPITSISQLRGKTIAVAQGSSGEYHLLTVLAKAGLTAHDVTLDNLQPADALAALTSGHIAAWDTWSPYIEQAVAQNGARVLVDGGGGYGYNTSFEVASRAAIDDPAKAAAIRDYLTVLNQAYTWSASHIQTWARIWGQATGLPDSIMLTAAKDDVNTPTTITGATTASE
jgi:sulfonate transport system substrate-binding protein